jgi:hypothetical protein
VPVPELPGCQSLIKERKSLHVSGPPLVYPQLMRVY